MDDNNRYILLHRPGLRWSYNQTVFFVAGCIMMPLTIFCISYLILANIFEKAVYPIPTLNGFTLNLIKTQWDRAITYNMIQNSNYTVLPPQNIDKKMNDKDLNNFKLICYYNFPENDFSLQIHKLDPNLCTHINVAFASVVNNSIYLEKKNLDDLHKVVKLKVLNKDLKILLSIGGASNEKGYAEMVKNHANRKIFIKSILDLVKTVRIDGVDLDWEFPGENTKNDPIQKTHFTQLLNEIRKTIIKQPKYAFLLSVAVAAPPAIIDVAYDVSYMNQYVDFINLMSYDYHFFTKITPFTGINSPLYHTSTEKFYLSTLNINYTSNYWNFLGMDKNKIIVGLPTYGHSFTIINSENLGLYAPARGYGKLGYYGFASYPLICNFLNINYVTPTFNMETYSPYALKNREWISFDNPQSLTYKSEFIRNNNFGGAMVYSLNTDDFKGECNKGNLKKEIFPLIRAIKAALNGVP